MSEDNQESISETSLPRLRAAVLGVGYLGRFHAQKYKALTDAGESVDLVAVCDPNWAYAEEVAKNLNVDLTRHPEDLLGRVDLVTIAAATPAHFELAQIFLKAGVHVLIEKPICSESSKGKFLVQLAKEKDLVFRVGHSERLNPAFTELKKRWRQFRFFDTQRLMPFQERTRSNDVVTDLLIHDLDLLLSLKNFETPQILFANGGKVLTDRWDWVQVLLEFSDGTRGALAASRMSGEVRRVLRAYSVDGVDSVDFQTGTLEEVSSGQKGMALQKFEFGKSDNLLIETKHFVQEVFHKNNRLPIAETPLASGNEAVMALELCEKVLSRL